MFKNYIKIAFRNLIKHKIYTFINITGLAIGLMCALLILLWVQDEYRMDRYHENLDNIYHAYLKSYQDGQIGYQSTVSPAIAPILKNEYPEIIETVRMGRLKEVVLKANNKMILEALGGAAEPSIFKIFTYPFIHGDPETALNEPHAIVLTESTARKYFGETNAVGQVIRMDNQFGFQVTGVIKDLPVNTFRKFDFIVPFVFLKELGEDIEGSPFYPCRYLTYVLLQKNSSYTELNEKIAQRIFAKGEVISFEISLQPFKDAYLKDTGGDTRNMILILIACVILGIACVNFTNLATARATIREKEIGVRKVTGASRLQLAKQFLSESILLTVTAGMIALALAYYFISCLNQLTGKSIFISLTEPVFVAGFLSIILFTGLFAGLYPAFYLSGFQPVGIFQRRSLKSGKSVLRKILIVSQFVLSVIFIICTIVMSRQINFMRNFNLGVNQNKLIYVYLDGEIRDNYSTVKQELLKNPHIISVTSASDLPIAIATGSYYGWGKDDGIHRRMCETQVGYDYLKTFGLEMAAGRFYSESYPQDQQASIVVNETAVRTVGLENPIGKPFFYAGRYYTLIGIVKDFHHNRKLRIPPEPLTFRLHPESNAFLFVKVNPELKDIHTTARTVDFIRTTCNRFSTERPLQFQYLDEFSFDSERAIFIIKQMVLWSTVLAIFISCLGLFGLSMFIIEQKTKEIGIRKTLGASVFQIVIMLSRDFVKWVILANLIAWPIAWFGMKQWLQIFAYRIDLNGFIFIETGLLTLILALLTVVWQSFHAATTNPVEALKYE